ncbi:cobalt-zinc-cadmium resistance protein czcC [Asticcacaulis biprosthecium C19]|uniref:Cobalt-zinc-cadmium resistance protein czcC n=1 Tax=Asticcacaulis biprosthecium C19 TaxID=715226 RepID=F4QHA4_9CAUL|nr:TolC family protein [Asticcacaulis biprosthecium]EGF92641.1 cobalt-zinc-cadmium resistance protein czcC [Asticcacaulis biprosthecium C19]
MIPLYLRVSCAKTINWQAAGLSLILAVPALAEPLPLSVALTRAAEADPAADATYQRRRAADAGIRQAGARLNPAIGVDVEDALGSGAYSGIDRMETTVTYQQTLERGGKRDARIASASAQRDLVTARGQVRVWSLMGEVHTLWIEATAAEATVALAEERLTLARTAQAEIGRRVAAARDPLFAGSLADTDVANAEIARDQAKAKAQQLKLQLAGYWGGGADIDLDPAWLEDLSAAGAEPVVMETPDLALLRAQQRMASADISVETSRSVQDPTLQAGIRHYQADNAFAFVIGGSIPLGRYNTNAGAIERSQAEAQAAAGDFAAAGRIRDREIAASTIRMVNHAAEVRRIDDQVIPQAQRAVAQVREGFARGGFSYRDVMGAQEVLMAAKARRLEVLKAFQLERARRERLSGQWVALLPEVAQ